jgi:Bacterial TniB protein
MPNLAISAQTNNGKTRLMKHFLSLHQASETSSGTIAAPVFYVQSPSIPEESRLYSAILLKLCKKFRPSAPPQEKLVLVLDALSKIEIRILALDEVNFTEVGTAASWFCVRIPVPRLGSRCKTTFQQSREDHRCRHQEDLSDSGKAGCSSGRRRSKSAVLQGAPRQISLSKLFANSIATFAFISARSAQSVFKKAHA